jgi:4-amino-4-deoxy-L-arabinose transferase-like glycosyltransferase
VGLAIIGLLAALIGQLLLNQYLLWGLVPAAVAVVLWGLSRQETADDRQQPLALLNVGLAVVLGLHFWNLGQSLPGLFYDEAVNISEALEIFGRSGWHAWSDNLSGRPTFFLYFLAVVHQLFGEGWLVARAAVVIVNALTVLAMVWALHPILGPRRARVAAVIFGVSAYHLLFSRIIYEASISSLSLLIAIGAAVRVTRDSRWRWWIALGLALGAGLWTYAAFRLVPLGIFAALGGWAVSRRSEWRRVGVGIAAASAIALVIASPLIRVAFDEPDKFLMRARETSVVQEFAESGIVQPLMHNVAAYGQMFFANSGTSNQIFHFAALGIPAAVLLWVGLGLAVGTAIRGRAGLFTLVVFWWFAGLVPGIITLSIEAPHWSRTLYALPAVAVVVALGLEGVVGLAAKRWKSVATAGILAIVIGGEMWAFHTHIESNRRVYEFFSPMPSRAAEIARQRVVKGRRVLASDAMTTEAYINHVFWTVAGDAAPEIARLILWSSTPPPGSARMTSVLLAKRDREMLQLLSLLYPNAELHEHRNPWGDLLVWELEIPGAADPPGGDRGGVLFRSTGDYRFSVREGSALKLEGLEIFDGDRLRIPAGIWRVDCVPECAKAMIRLSGPEGFPLRDHLFDDPQAGQGLLATYRNEDGSTHTQLDRIFTANMRGRDQGSLSILWDGWLGVPSDGEYGFRTISDDGSRVWIDGALVVDNWGQHGIQERRESLMLDRGDHRFQVEYEDLGGFADFELTWVPPGADGPQDVPASLLRPLSGPQRLDRAVVGK